MAAAFVPRPPWCPRCPTPGDKAYNYQMTC